MVLQRGVCHNSELLRNPSTPIPGSASCKRRQTLEELQFPPQAVGLPACRGRYWCICDLPLLPLLVPLAGIGKS